MKAMILAAGLGTRLGELTKSNPKALVEVAGKPLLGHIIARLVRFGFTDITVNVHHFAQQVIDYINRSDFGVSIHISDESDQLLDTGGGILKAKNFLDGDEPFLVHNVDILSDIDLTQLMLNHQQRNALVTLAVGDRKSSRKLMFDPQMHLRGWKNITTGNTIIPILPKSGLTELSFAGIHVLSPEIYSYLNQIGVFSIIDTYLNLCAKHKIVGVDVSARFVLDVGKPESIATAGTFLQKS